ncbi:MAG: right-handed parallel beta-helix repeat-containing protein [Candidatus Caldatribacteriaceae bacterium]
MVLPFYERERYLLEVAPEEEIILEGPPGGALCSFPPFLTLEDHLDDTWVFRSTYPVPGMILSGNVAFRQRGKMFSVELVLKSKRVPHSSDKVFFPEESSSLPPLRGRVLLASGEYILPPKTVLSGEVALCGEKGNTVLVGYSEGLRIVNATNAHFNGITFFHRGPKKGNVVVVLGGKVVFEHCTFMGGVPEKLSWMGNGLVIARGAEVLVRHCLFLHNQGSGLVIEKESMVTVEDSLFYHNSREGLILGGKSFARVSKCTFRENAWGILLSPHCRGEFRENRITKNTLGGILVSSSNEAFFYRNEIWEHLVGVVCGKGSQIVWQDNHLFSNQRDFLQEK